MELALQPGGSQSSEEGDAYIALMQWGVSLESIHK